MPSPDHLGELLSHLQCFYKDQRKKYRSDFEPDTMSSYQKTPSVTLASEYLQCSKF